MSSTGATVQVAVHPRDATLSEFSGRGLWPLLLPCSLLIVGALVGYPFSLDVPVAGERLVGLIVAGGLALGALVWLRRLERPAPVLVAATTAALLGGLWVISATGPDVFRGSVG
ncbi:MAG TPA: hypothetical protein VGQ62_20920, partial [Chloroflexota bacterium]|nr:hypothetical protein [Chloroflexota bacterium]